MVPKRMSRAWLCAACSLLTVAGASGAQAPAGKPPLNVSAGQQETSADYLRARAQAQIETAKRVLTVEHGFRFKDEMLASGIRFKHEPTDDGMSDYAMVHYDHGNGILVADVDGDDKYDIYFVTQLGRNELWRNRGDGTFEDITDRAGVGVADKVSVTGAFADFDNDGDADLYVTTVRMGNVLFENDGTGVFRDVTEGSGLGYVGHSSTPVVFDYDRDGLLDVFLTNVGVYTTDARGREGYWIGMQDAFSGHLKPERFEASILFRNLGDWSFEDVSARVGLEDLGWSGDATPMDINQDGWQDLYVLSMQGDDHYYENVGGEKFVEKTPQYFRKTPWGAMGVKSFDFDNNGLMDLLLTDMHSDMSKEIGPEKEKLKAEITWEEKYLLNPENNIFGNALYQQTAPGTFVEVSDAMGVENYWPWGVSVEDLNADGWDDVLIASSMNYPFRYGVNSLLLNNAGKGFVDSEFLLGIEPRVHGFTMRPWFPLDCAGVDKEHKHCVESGHDGQLLVWGALGSRTSVMFDLDDDGDVDIVTGEFNGRSQVFLSDLAQNKSIQFAKVRLRGTKSNRDGLGAVVRLTAGGRTLTKVHDGKSGYLSQSRLPLYFGLGSSRSIDKIEVDWPSGEKQVVENPGPVNTLIEVVEPGG